MSVSYPFWRGNLKKRCHTKAFKIQNDPTRSASPIDLFGLGRVIHPPSAREGMFAGETLAGFPLLFNNPRRRRAICETNRRGTNQKRTSKWTSSFDCQAASIRIFFFDRFGQYHSQERVTVQSFKKFLAKKRINALACSKILSNTST